MKQKLAIFALSLGTVGLIAYLIEAVRAQHHLTDITIVYLLIVIIFAVNFGGGPALFTAVISVFAIDYFFCPPIHTLELTDPAQILTLSIFLLTAAITSKLTAGMRRRLQEAQQHELQLTALSEASWKVASEPKLDRSMEAVLSKLREAMAVEAVAIIGSHDQMTMKILAKGGVSDKEAEHILTGKNREAIQFVFLRALPIGNYALDFPNAASAIEASKDAVIPVDPSVTLLPVMNDQKVSCVLYIRNASSPKTASDRQLLVAFVNHIALAWQRDQFFKAEALAQALVETDKLKTALLSMVSHDFRTPLTSIKTNIGTLKNSDKEQFKELKQTLLDAIDEDLDRLNRMVGNILDLSRLESGAWQPKCEPVPLTELLDGVMGTFENAQDQRIQIFNKGGSDLVWLDTVQIHQVLRNLLENALKYSAADTKVDLITQLQDGLLQIEVLDRGVGLVSEDEAQIFTPFYRGKSLIKSTVPGTGMGLAICRGLVEAHGGTIIAELRSGGGTCFRVTLPYQRKSNAEFGKT